MDFNQSFLNWICEQTQLDLDVQLEETPKPQADVISELSSNCNVDSDVPVINAFTGDEVTSNKNGYLDMFLSQNTWDHNAQQPSSPLLQFGGSSGSSSSSTGLSDSDDKDTMESHALSRGNASISRSLKVSVPDSTSAPRASYRSTMPTTGRLDFRVTRTADCNVSDSELKKMTSKERRQLRNKISARNFRQRRKDFIASLEEQIEKLESEKAQLEHKVTRAYEIVDKLQKENDQLRADLAVAQQPVTAVPAAPQILMSNTTNDGSAITMWDSFLQDSTWLSHVAMPRWDFSHLFSKDQERPPFSSSLVHMPAREAFRRYPLLGPALMSIVLDHAMGFSTDELIKLTSDTNPEKKTKDFLPLAFEAIGDRGYIEELKEESDDDGSESEDDQDADELEEPPAGLSGRACLKSWFKKNVCCKDVQRNEPPQMEQQKHQECTIKNLSYWIASNERRDDPM
ncbi:hypothetical protein BX666DRAFT_1882539 [Dichotomocladium elegans]|nr:hypothetical protein BX666DRAFT_1882539 [Dichotomocladium elegans]